MLDKFIKAVSQAVEETFDTMVFLKAMPKPPITGNLKEGNNPKELLVRDGITGAIGFTGSLTGTFSVYFEPGLARKVASSMLGEELSEVNEDVKSAVGEIANIVLGRAKTLLSTQGYRIEITPPTIVAGKNYSLTTKGEEEKSILPFEIPSVGVFYVEIGVKK